MQRIKTVVGYVMLIASIPFYLFTIAAFLLTTVVGWTGDIGSDYGVTMRIMGMVLLGLNVAVTSLGYGLIKSNSVKLPAVAILLCLGFIVLSGSWTNR